MKKATLIVMLFLVLLAINSCFIKKEIYEEYLITEGYVGWIRIRYEVRGAPLLAIKDGKIIYKIPESGISETSSPLVEGWTRPSYYYYSENTKTSIKFGSQLDDPENMIWYGTSNKYREQFFIGNEWQKGHLERSGCSKEKDDFGYIPKNIRQCLENYKISVEKISVEKKS